MFVCSVLGRKLSLTSIMLYIIIGLFLAPVFGLGGGIKYLLNMDSATSCIHSGCNDSWKIFKQQIFI